ncbi:hypothetical protein CR513_04825, partial [Mucuna pruriens]
MNEVVAVDNHRLENKITELTSLVRQVAIRQHHNSLLVRECGIYQPPPPFRPQQPMQPEQQSFLEELDLQTQISQLATMVNQLQSKGFG